jgi:hypothetical protein
MKITPQNGAGQPGAGGGTSGPAGGDTSGSFPAPTVTGINGIPLSPTAPTNGQVYAYDSGSGLWVPASFLANPMTTKGDVILGDTGGAPTRLGAGTSADVLTSNGAGNFPSWQTPGGGASLTPSDGPFWAPWAGPGSPDAANAEFTGSQLAGMTRVAHGTPKGTWAEQYSVASFLLTATGGNPELDVFAQARTMSVGDYVEIGFQSFGRVNYLGAFVGFADGVTFNNSGSHVVGAFLHNNGGAYRTMLNIWDGYNTRTTDGTILDYTATLGFIVAARVKYEAANTWGLYVSTDAANWYAVQTNYSKTMTPTHVLFGASMLFGPTAPGFVDLQYFRVNG